MAGGGRFVSQRTVKLGHQHLGVEKTCVVAMENAHGIVRADGAVVTGAFAVEKIPCVQRAGPFDQLVLRVPSKRIRHHVAEAFFKSWYVEPQPVIVTSCLPDLIGAFDHEIFDIRLQFQTAQAKFHAGLQQMAFVWRDGDILPEFVCETRHAGMHIRHGRKNFEEKSLRRLMLQKQIRKRCDILLRVFETLERQHVIAYPVRLDTDGAITVEEDARQALQAAFAEVEQKRQRLLMVDGSRRGDVACGDETFRQ